MQETTTDSSVLAYWSSNVSKIIFSPQTNDIFTWIQMRFESRAFYILLEDYD